MDAYTGFILAALALTGSPGPNTLSLAAVGAAFGRKRGLKYMTGLSFGVVLVILITGTGISGLVLAIPGAAPVIAAIAGLYFLYLAYRIATAPPVVSAPDTANDPKWYDGVILSLLNPKAYAAMAALFSGFVLVVNDPLLDALTKAALTTLTILFVNSCWLLTGSLLTPFLTNPKTNRIINISFAILLILSMIGVFLI